jgi:hypothetical protein
VNGKERTHCSSHLGAAGHVHGMSGGGTSRSRLCLWSWTADGPTRIRLTVTVRGRREIATVRLPTDYTVGYTRDLQPLVLILIQCIYSTLT